MGHDHVEKHDDMIRQRDEDIVNNFFQCYGTIGLGEDAQVQQHKGIVEDDKHHNFKVESDQLERYEMSHTSPVKTLVGPITQTTQGGEGAYLLESPQQQFRGFGIRETNWQSPQLRWNLQHDI